MTRAPENPASPYWAQRWAWYCDDDGCTSMTEAVSKSALPSPQDMQAAGWFIAYTFGDRCPPCVAAKGLPAVEGYPMAEVTS